MYKVWLNTNEYGIITSVYGGHQKYIVPSSEEYDWYFEVSDEVFKNIGSYKVVSGDLVLIS